MADNFNYMEEREVIVVGGKRITVRDVAIIGGIGITAAAIFIYRDKIKEWLGLGISEKVKEKIDETIKHINEIDRLILILQQQQTEFDKKFTEFIGADRVITVVEQAELDREMNEMQDTMKKLKEEVEKAKKSSEEAKEATTDPGLLGTLKELGRKLIELATVVAVVILGAIAFYGLNMFIRIIKGLKGLAEYFKRRKGGGGMPESPTPIIPLVPYIPSPFTRMPFGVPNPYNPIYFAPPTPTDLPEYKTVPTDTPPELIPEPTPEQERALDKWKEVWLLIERSSAETKKLVADRLPDPLKGTIYYSWDYLPLAFASLFGGPLVKAASWKIVYQTGEFGRFATALGVILAAVLTVLALVYIGFVVASTVASAELGAWAAYIMRVLATPALA